MFQKHQQCGDEGETVLNLQSLLNKFIFSRLWSFKCALKTCPWILLFSYPWYFFVWQ